MTPVSHSQRRPLSLLIVGCGDVGLRVARQLNEVRSPRWRLLGLTSSRQRVPLLRAAGLLPLVGNLDEPNTLYRLAGLADLVLHLVPPPSSGRTDPRTDHLIQALRRCTRLRHVVYASTTGVYGDTQGAHLDETRAVAPDTERAHRRVAAEEALKRWGRTGNVSVTVLRVPGIYALDRVGGDPRERVRRGSPILRADEDVFTNRIHADDLARACIAALLRGRPQRAVNVCDDAQWRMGDYYEWVAQRSGLPLPPRVSREEAQRTMSPMQWSFLCESRRLRNERMKKELRVALRYPTPASVPGWET